MKKAVFLIIVFSMLLGSGCATIVSKSEWPVMVTTNPSGAACTVRDVRGAVVTTAVTPTSLMLRSGDGYFKRADYTIRCEKEGYEAESKQFYAHLNNWYWGNILFGGLIGMLAVDPGTGAMWQLDESVSSTMITRPAALSPAAVTEAPTAGAAASSPHVAIPDSPAQDPGKR